MAKYIYRVEEMASILGVARNTIHARLHYFAINGYKRPKKRGWYYSLEQLEAISKGKFKEHPKDHIEVIQEGYDKYLILQSKMNYE